jgi:hypothetical protein
VLMDVHSDFWVDANVLANQDTRLPWTEPARVALPQANTVPGIPGPSNTPLVEGPNGDFPRGSWGYLQRDQVPKFVGRLVIENGSSTGYCTGTLIAKDVMITAAHCVVNDDDPANLSFADQVSFFAGEDGAVAYGTWRTAAATDIYPSPDYVAAVRSKAPKGIGITHDWAVIKLAPNEYGHAGDVHGFVPVAPQNVGGPEAKVGIMYPTAGFFTGHCENGCAPTYCSLPSPPLVASGQPGYNIAELGCPLSQGASGASYFAQIGGRWFVVSVESGGVLLSIKGERKNGDDGSYIVNNFGSDINGAAFQQEFAKASA